jgi:glycosyltransferase involved in cell wall biosynthesis
MPGVVGLIGNIKKQEGLHKAVADQHRHKSFPRLTRSDYTPHRVPGPAPVEVGLLTGGDDKTYAWGLTDALVSQGVHVDFIGSDNLDSPHLHGSDLVNFLNLRGSQNEKVSRREKVVRIITYYLRLLKYAAVARPRILHILWNNKFEFIDRTILMVCYKAIGKKLAFTAHNVNAAKRDSKDSWLNRITLAFQYRTVDHIFVHTNRMKDELVADFSMRSNKITVIPFGINNVYPCTDITADAARARLGLGKNEKVALFFGRIAPYKGLEYLVSAMSHLQDIRDIRLIIAGKVKAGYTDYWSGIQREIERSSIAEKIIAKVQYIPDEDVELYFKGADALILPYTQIFQSGLPFLAYSFGLPVVATDVGSLREDIIEGRTGFICAPRDPADLAEKMKTYFSSDLYSALEARRQEIRDFANERYSWTKVAEMTTAVYKSLLTV